MSVTTSRAEPGLPPRPVAGPPLAQPFHHLDALWIQLAGTRCNLACTHCFVTCGPDDERLPMMSRADVARWVDEAVSRGVREIYYTGGEPFLHGELLAILADTVARVPCTVLTNGTLLTAARVAALAELARGSRWTLELRVSLDGAESATHDAIRGTGTWDRTLAGLRRLERAGLLPIVTFTNVADEDPLVFRERCARTLRDEGLARPRLKLLPMFALGRERTRRGGSGPSVTLADLDPALFDPARLPCGTCRAVTARGVHVCPLLVDEPGGRMGSRLADAERAFVLDHEACVTCWISGSTCGNA